MQCPKCRTHQSHKETCGWCGEPLAPEPLGYEEALDKHGGYALLSPYEKGYVEALYAYAVHLDGRLIVGSGIHTLGQAVDAFLSERERQLRDAGPQADLIGDPNFDPKGDDELSV